MTKCRDVSGRNAKEELITPRDREASPERGGKGAYKRRQLFMRR